VAAVPARVLSFILCRVLFSIAAPHPSRCLFSFTPFYLPFHTFALGFNLLGCYPRVLFPVLSSPFYRCVWGDLFMLNKQSITANEQENKQGVAAGFEIAHSFVTDGRCL
jgi:hypothetical protein